MAEYLNLLPNKQGTFAWDDLGVYLTTPAINHMLFMTPVTSYVSCNPRPQMLKYSLHIVHAYGPDKDLECTYGITCNDTTCRLQMCLLYILGQNKMLFIFVENKFTVFHGKH